MSKPFRFTSHLQAVTLLERHLSFLWTEVLTDKQRQARPQSVVPSLLTAAQTLLGIGHSGDTPPAAPVPTADDLIDMRALAQRLVDEVTMMRKEFDLILSTTRNYSAPMFAAFVDGLAAEANGAANHIESVLDVDEQLRQDKLIYGAAFWVEVEGKKKRCDPRTVKFQIHGGEAKCITEMEPWPTNTK